MLMSDEGCGDFEVEKDKNICSHFLGDPLNRKEFMNCNLYCSLQLLKQPGEIDTSRCT